MYAIRSYYGYAAGLEVIRHHHLAPLVDHRQRVQIQRMLGQRQRVVAGMDPAHRHDSVHVAVASDLLVRCPEQHLVRDAEVLGILSRIDPGGRLGEGRVV